MAQQSMGLRFGKPEANSVAVVACSLVSADIVIAVEGIGSTTVSLSQLGTDNTPTQDQAGFVGSASITGLSEYTKYTYTATQGSNSVTGYFWTAPSTTDDFILIPITCDNIVSLGGDPAGGYTQCKAIAQANPSKGVYFAHIDDHYGYMDFNEVDEGAFGDGHVTSGGGDASVTALVYDYALGAFSAFGLYHPSGNAYCTAGHNEDRIWCMKNIPVLPVWGDHDCGVGDMGWTTDPTDATGSPSPLTKFNNAKTVWNAFLLPLQGDSIQSADTDSNHWAHTLGCVKLIAPDGITKASGDAAGAVKPTTIYGTNQVTDLIAACDDSSVTFKILLMQYSIRNLQKDKTATSGSGAQYPIGGNENNTSPLAAHADYAKLMTDAGGLMSLSSCNGRAGVLISVHGDDHIAKVVSHKNTAGTNDEWFTEICVGTINGSINFDIGTVAAGDIVDGATVEMIESVDQNNDWWVVPFYVYGSRELKEIEVDFMDRNGATLWNKKFVESRGMNEALPLTYDPVLNSSVAGSESL